MRGDQGEAGTTWGRQGADARSGGALRICHLIQPAPHGGAESVVRALAAGHLALGHEVSVAALLQADQPAEHDFLVSLAEAGVPVRAVRYSTRAYMKECREVLALLRDLRPDLVHFHGARAVVLHGGTARRLRIPKLVTVHGFTGGGLRVRFYDGLHRFALRRFEAVVAVSYPLEKFLARHLAPTRLVCIPNAWSPRSPVLPTTSARALLGLPIAGFQIGWIGRLEPEKGADVLIEALVYLRDLPWHATLIGAGSEGTGLQKKVADLGLQDRIRFAGAIPDAARLCGAFDVIALSSRTEGTPIVLFEAMAASVPIVATAVGGIPDVVGNSSALLVPPEDPRHLAEALRAALLDRRAALARSHVASRILRDRFGEEAWFRAYEELYRRLSHPEHPD
jgi:glycosyltransferase involved in cell wall biosynthesis